MKNLSKLILYIIGCELVGIIGSVFSITAIPTWYQTLNKPFFSPPNWIFGPVWTILYCFMGIAAYLVWQSKTDTKKHEEAKKFFLAQLAVNFIWTPVFFGLKSPIIALFVIILMWILIVMTIKKCYSLSKWAAYLLVPYLLWVTFATMLNAAIVILN